MWSFIRFCGCLMMTLKGLNIITLIPVQLEKFKMEPIRTEKTICLAVSPPLKSYGVPGRPRLFEVIQRIREVNEERRRRAPGRQFRDKSWRNDELKADPSLAVSYLVAPPRMAHYMKWSTQIYQIYLRYVAPEDIHVYSIDEVFMDVTEYLGIYKVSPRELAKRIIRTVLKETGITATAGIGTNLYLCKVAMDIVAKHVEADKDGVRIAELDEQSYRELLCGREVFPENAGSEHRNHCPNCLSSLHVDNEVGDRESDCGGIMEPIGVWVRKNGEWAIIHRCKRCGKISSNRTAADDNPMKLMSLALKPLAFPPFPLEKIEELTAFMGAEGSIK